jgi:hypothetical protein
MQKGVEGRLERTIHIKDSDQGGDTSAEDVVGELYCSVL